jgi:hypothetical protein
MKMAVFWGLIALVMKAVSISETSVSFYQTTRRNIPEDSHFRRDEFFNLNVLLFYDNKPSLKIGVHNIIRGSFTRSVSFSGQRT